MTRRIALVSLTLAAACGSPSDNGLCLGNDCVFVATSIFNPDFTGSGTLNSVDLATRAPHVGLDATLDPDTTLKIVDQELFVLQRDSGSLRIYDAKTFTVKVELTLGDATHEAGMSYPQDFWVAGDGKIWVSLSGNDAEHALVVVDRTKPGTVEFVGLPQDPADTDGKPEPFELYACNDKLYVLLDSYFFDTNQMINYVPGRIAIIDPTTRTARGTITLAGKNPYNIAPLSGDCNDVVVAAAAGLTTPPDGFGNLERIDLDAAASKGVLATDTVLGGRPTLLASVDEHLLYVAMYFDPQPDSLGNVLLSSAKVIAFDPTNKVVKGDVSDKFGQVNLLATHGDKVFVGSGYFAAQQDSTKAPRGLYISPADGSMLAGGPIDLQLTPSAIALP